MIIKFLGTCNAESNNTRLVSLLIDNILAIDAGSLTSKLSFAEQKKIKVILLSHGHYDHIRDVPAFAFNNSSRTTKVLATQETLGILSSHLIDGIIYPQFAGKTSFLEKPALELLPLEPFKPKKVGGYQIMAVPVNHSNHGVGFEVISKDGRRIFYTGDTGPGLSDLWQYVSPELLIVDMTFPDRLEKTALDAGHLCPELLRKELREFRRIKGYLPRVVTSHLTPWLKEEIEKEVEKVAKEMELPIIIAAEDVELTI
ncbi:MAG: MBL fold metallo-hydrolase [Dehalococcoidales bacterium]|nr:MBL fold metallo-hydrolase [Dehalococcoidales bacterium]